MSSILAAIQQLLEFKGSATFTEIAGVSEKKRFEVLECLNKNSNLVIKDKTGKITGLVDVVEQQRAMDFHAGKTWRTGSINYGCDTAIICMSSKVDGLRKTYWNGGFGDSYPTREILYTAENVKAVEALGIVHYNTPEVKTIEDLWRE